MTFLIFESRRVLDLEKSLILIKSVTMIESIKLLYLKIKVGEIEKVDLIDESKSSRNLDLWKVARKKCLSENDKKSHRPSKSGGLIKKHHHFFKTPIALFKGAHFLLFINQDQAQLFWSTTFYWSRGIYFDDQGRIFNIWGAF